MLIVRGPVARPSGPAAAGPSGALCRTSRRRAASPRWRWLALVAMVVAGASSTLEAATPAKGSTTGKDQAKPSPPPPTPPKPKGYAVQLTAIRAIDGSNSGATLGQGAAGKPLKRIVPAAYPGDGSGTEIIESPDRANPRTISNLVVAQGAQSIPSRRQLTDFVWAWGQFIDHDLDLTLTTPLAGTADIPIEDPQDILGPDPIHFSRSNFVSGTGKRGAPRQHANAITSFLDGSQVYGSDAATALSLRAMQGGLLKTSAGDLLPVDANGQFLAGDIRVNENVALMAVQALFVREHNRLARILAVLAPAATDEQLYQLARKIVGAEIQIITYREFLPALMGRSAPPISLAQGAATGDPSVATEFSTALYRVGHTMLSPNIALAEQGAAVGSLPLRDAFFRADFLSQNPTNLDRVLEGLSVQVSQEIDIRIVDDVRNFLFGPPGAGGFDLASLNIQRGRDHGLPDYNTLRKGYGLSAQSGFAGITSNASVAVGLETLYEKISNVDPWVGALSEDHLSDSSLGPLLTAGLADQFRRTLAGDRFSHGRDKDLQQPLIQAAISFDQVSLGQIVRSNTASVVWPQQAFRKGVAEVGDVQAVVDPRSGRVYIQGNRLANRISLVESPLGLVCVGQGGTRVNGAGTVLLETSKNPSITIDLGEGDDQVSFVGGKYREVCLVVGAGADTVTSALTTFELKLSDE